MSRTFSLVILTCSLWEVPYVNHFAVKELLKMNLGLAMHVIVGDMGFVLIISADSMLCSSCLLSSLCTSLCVCRFGVTPFTPLKGLFIQGPIFISFFFAVSWHKLKLLFWINSLSSFDIPAETTFLLIQYM